MEHHYCIFIKNDRLQFGWIREVRKNKLVILPELGKEFNCSQNRVEYIWQGAVYPNEKEALAHLIEKSSKVAADSAKIELDVIHELCDPGETYTVEELARDFLDEPDDGWQRVALLVKIKEDGKLFKQKKNLFYARTHEEISGIEEEEIKKREAEKRQLLEHEWADKLLNKKHPDITEEFETHWKHFLHRLKNFLLHLEKSQEKEYFCTLFHCRISDPLVTERLLLDCLSVTEYGLSWGKLILERVFVEHEHDEDEIAEMQQLTDLDIWENPFGCDTKDQRHLTTYTVDNAETKDFDDAVSWEKSGEGMAIHIHIADVASYVTKDTLLFRKAEKRLSSLYTVKAVYPMFHPDLSEDAFSLIEGKDRPVVTFEILLNDQGEIESTDIFRSVIHVDRNLSYEDVDQALQDQNSFWHSLWTFCRNRKERRIENGSLEIDRIEVKLDISDPENIRIKATRENTPANMMIQELAISANYQAASFAREHSLPCLFRNQPPYSINKDLGEGAKPTLKDINIQPARISLEPDNHSALGLDCYLQITSPIRRFLDLINQGIILGRLSLNEDRYSPTELLMWAKQGEEIQREYNQTERKLLDHWKRKYLAQNRDEIYDAQLIRYFRNGKAQINILKVQLYIDTSIEELQEDEVFQVVIDSVDTKYDRIVVRQYVHDSIVEDEENA